MTLNYTIDCLLESEGDDLSAEDTGYVALASGDDIRDIDAALTQLENESIGFEGGQLISLAYGGTGLSFIPELNPSSIRFFDENRGQLLWMMAVVHLIRQSASRKTFLQRIFSRKLSKLPRTSTEADRYLQTPGDPKILARTLNLFDNDMLRTAFETMATRILQADYATVSTHMGTCSGLAMDGRVIGISHDLDTPVPDTFKSFYLHYGWLKSKSTYTKTRSILNDIPVTFHQAKLGDLPLETWTDGIPWTYFFVGKLNGIYPQQWVSKLIDWRLLLTPHFPSYRLILLTAFDGVGDIVNDPLSKLDLNLSSAEARRLSANTPHFRAWQVIITNLRGTNIAEVTLKQDIGFHEINREIVPFDAYLTTPATYSSVIFHAPLTSGAGVAFLDKCLRKAWKENSRIILYENNPECKEFSDGDVVVDGGAPTKRWLTLTDALKRVKKVLPKGAKVSHHYIDGLSGKRRNWIIIADNEKIIPKKRLSKLSLEELVSELRLETMRLFKTQLFSNIAAEKFTEKDFEAVILAAKEAHTLSPAELSITELYAWAMCYDGDPNAAGAAIAETARLHGGVTDEIQQMAEKFGFMLTTDRNT